MYICSSCGAAVDEYDNFCRNCGCSLTGKPVKKKKSVLGNALKVIGLIIAFLALVIVLIFGLAYAAEKKGIIQTEPIVTDPFLSDKSIPEEEYKASCIEVDYKSVARNPHDYNMKHITFTGRVSQVLEGTPTFIMIYQDNPNDMYSLDSWYVLYDVPANSSRILENDLVKVYGTCTGITTYTTVSETERTIPSLQLFYFDFLN